MPLPCKDTYDIGKLWEGKGPNADKGLFYSWDVNYPPEDLCVKGLVPRLALLGDAVVF